jgi:serine/threonine protein kinase
MYERALTMIPPQLECVARKVSADIDLVFDGYVGSGAFKETYKVIDNDDLAYALKIYRPGSQAQRTEREIDAMQRCSHSGIAKLNTVATTQWQGNTFLYSVEEYIAGGTLTRRFADGLLSSEETAALGCKLIEALEHIASQNLVHRDLKPDNIMIRQDRITPVIIDFGIVRDLSNASLTASWLLSGPGTPFFSPPEQLRNDKALVDWRSDQFSLGVVLALGSLGFHPYAEEGLSDAEVVQRVADRQPLPGRFKLAAAEAGMPILIDMTEPWPINRLRTPRQLMDAWKAQWGLI